MKFLLSSLKCVFVEYYYKKRLLHMNKSPYRSIFEKKYHITHPYNMLTNPVLQEVKTMMRNCFHDHASQPSVGSYRSLNFANNHGSMWAIGAELKVNDLVANAGELERLLDSLLDSIIQTHGYSCSIFRAEFRCVPHNVAGKSTGHLLVTV